MALSNLDRELLQNCLNKLPDAWENFSDRFLGLVVHVVNHTAAVRNIEITAESRDDLVAEVFLSWIDKDFAVLRRFRGQSSLATYLTVVARRVIVRRLAQLRLPHPSVSIDDVDSGLLSQHDGLSNEDREELEQGLLHLSSQESQVIRMFHLDGLSYREIASRTGMQENSIGPYLSRAREKMKQKLS